MSRQNPLPDWYGQKSKHDKSKTFRRRLIFIYLAGVGTAAICLIVGLISIGSINIRPCLNCGVSRTATSAIATSTPIALSSPLPPSVTFAPAPTAISTLSADNLPGTILYVAYDSPGGFYSIKPATGQRQVLLDTSREQYKMLQSTRPYWSKDGKQILVLINKRNDTDIMNTYVYALNVDGSNFRQVLDRPLSDELVKSALDWSPDGKTILGGGLTAVDLGNPSEVRLPFKGIYPSFSRDGQQIVYNCTEGICIADNKGISEKTVTTNGLNDLYPELSPDGKTIAFVKADYDAGSHPLFSVAVMDIDGKNMRRVSGYKIGIVSPHWSPDGKYLVYSSQNPVGIVPWSIFVVNVANTQEANLGLGLYPYWIP